MTEDHRHVRREYASDALRRSDLRNEPLAQFTNWLSRALEDGLTDATAMSLATAGSDGAPSVRIVLLKAHDKDGLTFYSDYGSQKGQNLTENPKAELLFHWREHNRQVRIAGVVERTSRRDAEAYFESRPLASQLSAAASEQSQPITDRQALEDKVTQLQYGEPTCPENWGGYRLRPEKFEFWQGRENRLHDRFVYSRRDSGWQLERLQP
ncbi:MAG: pyridoxamine 5'-phosphate oxidase [Pseudomonadales bacterium]|nr:pyridoxamine 5'-phosphate oxidase [Pseudomonadales bacterium]